MMSMMKCARLTVMLVAGLGCLAASAQDKPAAKKKSTGPAGASGMPMAKPAPEMKDLRDLIGTCQVKARKGGDESTR